MCILLIVRSLRYRFRHHIFVLLIAMATVASGTCTGYAVDGTGWGAVVGTCAALPPTALAAFALWQVRPSPPRVEPDDDAAQQDATDRAKALGMADAVLNAVRHYLAAAFPLTPGGVSAAERQAHRSVAYRLSAADGTPREVQVAAAAALEAIDQGREEVARSAVNDLTLVVIDCRHPLPPT